MHTIRSLVFSCLSVCFFVSGHLTTLANTQPLNEIVAVVNDQVITHKQLIDQMHDFQEMMENTHQVIPDSATLRHQVLNSLIDQELLFQASKVLNYPFSDALLNAAIDNLAKHQHLSLEELKSQVEKSGLSYSQFRERLWRNLLMELVVKNISTYPNLNITQQEIDNYVRDNPHQNLAYHIEDLLIPVGPAASSSKVAEAEQQAIVLLQTAKKGKSLQQLANLAPAPESKPLTAQDLGWRSNHELPDIFLNAIKFLKPGSLAGPLRADNGWHIVRLLAVREDKGNDFENLSTLHARHILIKTSPLIDDIQAQQFLTKIREKILQKDSFSAFAKQHSQDLSSAGRGGDLGWIVPGESSPVMLEMQLRQLPIHLISQPFKTEQGWHIAQILEQKPFKITDPNTHARYQASLALFQIKSNQAVERWLKKQREQAYIKILLPPLKTA